MSKRNLIYLFWATLFSYTTLSMLIPTFPAYVLKLGGNPAQIGLTWGAFTAGILVFRPVAGRWTDRKGRRWVALLGTFIFFVSPLLYVAFPSIASLYFFRFLHGIGSAAFTTASVTLVTDSTTVENRGHTLGLMGTANNVGVALGPWMGSQLVQAWGFKAMFMAAAGLALISLAAALPIREVVKPALDHEPISYPRAVLRRCVLLPSAVLLIAAIIHTSVMSFLPVFLDQRQILSAGPYFMTLGLAMLIVRAFARPILNAQAHRLVIFLSLLGMTAGILMIVYAVNSAWLLGAAVMYGFSFAVIRPVLTSFLANHTPVTARGTVFSFYEGAYDLGMSLSGIVLGLVANSFDLVMMFYVTIAIGIVGQLISTGLTDSLTREPVEWSVVLQEEQSIHQ
ncbi:MAG: MFS transporter [Acidobacteria bacterium]|nr:MFS transporter [Acidobacteriota bacterium]